MKRYVVVAANARMGGARQVALGLAAAFDGLGAPVEFAAGEALLAEMPPSVRGPALTSATSIARLREARAWIKRGRPPAALLLDNLPLLSGVPECVLVHNALLVAKPLTSPRVAWLRATLPSAACVVAPTEALATDLERTMRRVRCFVIPHGVGQEFLDRRRPATKTSEELSIVNVGLPSPQKNQERLILAVASLRDRRAILTLTVEPESAAGKALHLLAADNGIHDRVHLVGAQSTAAVSEMLAEADVFAFPSVAESFGLPLLEAMAVGVPVVTSDRPWAREVCADNAVFVDPLSVDSIAAGITTVQDQRRQSSERVSRARGLARRLTWDRAAKSYLELLHRIARP